MLIRTKTILSFVLILVGVLGFVAVPGAQERHESYEPYVGAPPPTKEDLAAAIVTPLTAASCLTEVTFDGVASQGAVFTSATPLQGFPTDTGSFAVLSSGIAAQAAPGPATTFVSTNLSGVTVPAGDP